MRSSASAPARASRMAITPGSLGRSTKTAEIMLRLIRALRRGWWAGRAGTDLDAGSNALDAIGDDHLAVFQPTRDHGGGWRRLSQLDAALLDLVAGADHIDVIPLLVRQHRLPRNP